MERLGIYGGTFDPPHRGHLFLARAALEQLALTKVLWVLTPEPPHKGGLKISPLDHRMAMLALALENQPDFILSRVDIDRPAPHYAVDTLRLLRQEKPEAALIYLIGADSLRDLPRWHLPDQLVDAVDEIGVLHRPGVHVDLINLLSSLPGLAEKLRWIDAPMQDISATNLRALAKNPQALRPFVPPKVLDYIKREGLYR